jgi:hypothetical protein
VFGSAIQLYASGSDSYIQCEKRRARDDSFAQLASLVPKGAKDQRSKMPWFRLMPGFATRAEGERVRFGDIICVFPPLPFFLLRQRNEVRAAGL